MSLQSKNIKDIKSLVKEVNKKIRAEHNEIKKKVLDKIRADRKVEIKTARTKLNEMLKKKLIPIARRQKSDLISDLNQNKKHWSAPPKGVPAAPPTVQEEKPTFITRRVGGKVRKIPIVKSSVRREKDAAKSDDARKAKAEVLAKIRKTDDKQKSLAAPASKKPLPKKPFNCNQCTKGSYTARCVPCMRKDLAKDEEKKKPAPKGGTSGKVPTITITEAPKEKKKIKKKVKSQLPPLKEKPMKLKLPKVAEAKAAPPKGVPSAPVKDDKLKALKKQLKELGVSSRVRKFIKTVAAAEEKLEEIKEEEATKDVLVDPIYLKSVATKDRKTVQELVPMILPRHSYSLADQRDYFDSMKDMNEDWTSSAQPRIKYEDVFDAAEKELFRILYPKWFTKPDVPEGGKPKKKKSPGKDSK